MEQFTFTVGKLDAGMAILIGDRAHLIEFPSLLLPPGITSGSIVNISVNRNTAAERAHSEAFWHLQDSILEDFGLALPSAPVLKLRHVTQTSVTLEWDKLHLATAKIRALEIYKNGTRLALIPNPTNNTSTKLSSLQSNEEYTFHLVLKTTAGTFQSNTIRVRTHTMADTSGISVCFGPVTDPRLLAHAKSALERMNAKWTSSIEIDTTHFVCNETSEPGSAGPSKEYQKAQQMSLPVVQPQWILACQHERRLMPISHFQLGMPVAAYSLEEPAPFSRRSSSPQVKGSGEGGRFSPANASGSAVRDKPESGCGHGSEGTFADQQSQKPMLKESVQPKPETPNQGKLDRNFKMPAAGSVSTPTSATGVDSEQEVSLEQGGDEERGVHGKTPSDFARSSKEDKEEARMPPLPAVEQPADSLSEPTTATAAVEPTAVIESSEVGGAGDPKEVADQTEAASDSTPGASAGQISGAVEDAAATTAPASDRADPKDTAAIERSSTSEIPVLDPEEPAPAPADQVAEDISSSTTSTAVPSEAKEISTNEETGSTEAFSPARSALNAEKQEDAVRDERSDGNRASEHVTSSTSDDVVESGPAVQGEQANDTVESGTTGDDAAGEEEGQGEADGEDEVDDSGRSTPVGSVTTATPKTGKSKRHKKKGKK